MTRPIVAVLLAGAITAGTYLAAQQPQPSRTPPLWSDEALRTWALPIAGVKTTPRFFTQAEYYAAPIGEVRTYPGYVKGREPAGYRDWMRSQGPQPLIEPAKLVTDADWLAAGREVFDPARLKNDYVPTGWNPPGAKTRAVPGHSFGLNLSAEDKRALIAFLRTL